MPKPNDGKMGIWMTTALVVGTIIGAGIFMLPVSLAPLGRNSIIGWLVSGVGALCIVFALAQLSRLGGNGIQANIEREFGPTTAFLTAWAFWMSNWVAEASVAVAAGSTLSFLGPQFGGPAFSRPVAIGCVLLVTLVNAIGVRAAGGLSIVTVVIKFLPLLAVIWLSWNAARGGPLRAVWPAPISFANLASATALTFFALTGFEAATAPVCKIRTRANHSSRAHGRHRVRRPALSGCRNRHSIALTGKRRCYARPPRLPTPSYPAGVWRCFPLRRWQLPSGLRLYELPDTHHR